MAKSFKKISDSAAAREQQSKIDALLSGTTNYPAEASSLQSPTPPTPPTSPTPTYPPLHSPTPIVTVPVPVLVAMPPITCPHCNGVIVLTPDYISTAPPKDSEE